MNVQARRHYSVEVKARPLGWGDAVVVIGLIAVVGIGVRVATGSDAVVSGASISLSPEALPLYTCLSLLRMSIAYLAALIFGLVYGYFAAFSRRGERILIPLLDILQSVPLLSFLPIALLSFNAILPSRIAAELASVFLIFTCQVWNLILTWYQSLTTVPKDLREVSEAFRMNPWMRLRTLQLPLSAIGLVWNSVVSWSNGWFFLMASETFRVGPRDFRLPGIGSYLQEAAVQGDLSAVAWAMATLILVILLMDQLIWWPMLSWSERFKLEMVTSEGERQSWFYNVLQNSRFAQLFFRQFFQQAAVRGERLLGAIRERFKQTERSARVIVLRICYGVALCGAVFYGSFYAASEVAKLPLERWGEISIALGATFFRVYLALALALLWTLPVGTLIGSNTRLASWLQPLVQVAAAVPATALFPILLLFVSTMPGGLDLAAVALMMMAAQWYLLFNIIAGVYAIPKDLKYTASLLQLDQQQRWRKLTLPAILPYVVTGGMTASGGAWNACVVAEYAHFSGRVEQTEGIGATIANATARGDYATLLASSIGVILVVIVINRFVWHRLYLLVEERYRME